MKKAVSKSVQGSGMRYVLIAVLVILLGFSVMYVYNIQRASEHYYNGKFSVIYVYSSTCPYCVKFTPVFTAWSQSLAPDGAVNASSYDRSDPIAAQYINQYNITAYPTVIVLKPDGSLSQTQVGYVDGPGFSKFVSGATQ